MSLPVRAASSTISARGPAGGWPPAVRSLAWIGLCGAELLTLSVVHAVPYASNWQNPIFYVRTAALWALCSAVAFGLLAWPQRGVLLDAWQSAQRRHDWRGPLLVNLVLFAASLAAAASVSARAAAGAAPATAWLVLYALLILATVGSLLRIDVSHGSLLSLAAANRGNLAAAAAAGLLVEILSYFAQDGWRPLSGATLELTRAILALYESDVTVIASEPALQVGGFRVIITDSCSGYEGIGLVTAFLAIYLWVFRASLRLPNALLLFPIGILCIWVLNSVRIAALVSIGAHVSPAIAKQGFHSQAGWIAFLAVTVAIMALAGRSAFFTRTATAPQAGRDRVAVAYLAPFIALMLSSIVMAAAAPDDQPLYALKVAAIALVLWLYRDVYRDIYRSSGFRLSGEAVLAGIVVGAAWIATDPAPGGGAALSNWLAQLSLPALVIWLGLRVVGSALLVPVAEELAFRGFLYRWLIARDFESVRHSHMSLAALAVSSLAFGVLHERWIAASLSGAVFALVMWRTGRLSAAITAHAVANALICAWAIAFSRWSLL